MIETTSSIERRFEAIAETVKIKSIQLLFGLVELAFGTQAKNWVSYKLLQWMDSIEIAKQMKTVREKANHVRDIVRKGRNYPHWANLVGDMYPEISTELEDCVLCKELFLLRIHPNKFCYTCWVELMSATQKGIKDVQAGMDVREAQRLFEERLARLTPATE